MPRRIAPWSSLTAFLLAATVALPAASSAPAAPAPAALQACADRFDWMHFEDTLSIGTVRAKVEAAPCRVVLDYTAKGSSSYASTKGYSFPCAVNSFGAYVCPSHAAGTPGGHAPTGQNATFNGKSGVVRLDAPPATLSATPKPGWVSEYPVEGGYIDPFEAGGRLRPGLTLSGKASNLQCTTFKNIKQPTNVLICPASLVCFLPTLPVRNGEPLACPTEAGARTFKRGVLQVLAGP